MYISIGTYNPKAENATTSPDSKACFFWDILVDRYVCNDFDDLLLNSY